MSPSLSVLAPSPTPTRPAPLHPARTRFQENLPASCPCSGRAAPSTPTSPLLSSAGVPRSFYLSSPLSQLLPHSWNVRDTLNIQMSLSLARPRTAPNLQHDLRLAGTVAALLLPHFYCRRILPVDALALALTGSARIAAAGLLNCKSVASRTSPEAAEAELRWFHDRLARRRCQGCGAHICGQGVRAKAHHDYLRSRGHPAVLAARGF